MGAVKHVWEGKAGLASTYWGYGILAGIPWGVALSLVTPGSAPAIVVVLAFFAYYVVVNVGIWRAASRYQGPATWRILAKLAVAALPAVLLIGTLAAVMVPALHSPQSSPALSPQVEAQQPRHQAGHEQSRPTHGQPQGNATDQDKGALTLPPSTATEVPHANEDGPWKKYQKP